jgi:hypothetical protein
MAKSAAFDVMLNGRRINTVFYPAELSAGEVRIVLTQRHHYDSNITVEKLG